MQRVISICTDTLNAETTKIFWDVLGVVAEGNRWLKAPENGFLTALVDGSCALYCDVLQCYELQQLCLRFQLREIFEIDGNPELREFADSKKSDAYWFAIEVYTANFANELNSLLAESGVPMKPGSKLDAIIDSANDEGRAKLEIAKWSQRIAQSWNPTSARAS